jgi:predicted alpha/beta hydrolase
MGVAAGFYDRFAQHLTQSGCGLAAPMEMRGQGRHPERARSGADFGYREIVEDDIPAELDRIEARHPGRPIYLVGHSLGGQLAVAASATLAHRLAGLVLVAAGTAHFRAWPADQRWRAWLIVHAIRRVAGVLPWYPGQRLGFGGDQPRRFMRDWSFNASTGRYRLEGSRRSASDIESALREVRLPVLSVGVNADPVAPPGAQAELLAKLPSAHICRKRIDGVLGDKPWRRHFSWAREPAEVVGCISDWLTRGERRDVVRAAHRSPSHSFSGDRHVPA